MGLLGSLRFASLAGFVQRGFVLRDLRPGEGRTRNHMACNPLLLPDVLLRLYMDKKPHVTKAVRKRSRKKGISLPLDTIENLFLCDPANGQSKAMYVRDVVRPNRDDVLHEFKVDHLSNIT